MKKIFFFFLCFIVLTIFANAQSAPFQWAKQMSGVTASSYSSASKLAVDGSGNIYTTGDFHGTVDFDPGAGIYNLIYSGGFANNAYISKIDASGNFVWAKALGGFSGGMSITTDTLGYVYIIGYFQGTIDFDSGVGVFNMTASGGDVFILKLDASGNFIWAKDIGGASSDCEGISIILDPLNNIFIAGYFSGTVDFDPSSAIVNLTSTSLSSSDIFVSKFDSFGNLVWARNMGGNSTDNGYSIALDSYDNVYTTGYFDGTGDFDPGVGVYNLISSGGSDIFISKLNSLGNFMWARNIGGTSGTIYDTGKAIKVAKSGNIYVVGAFEGAADFDPGAGTFNLTSLANDNAFILKMDSLGNFIWAKNIAETVSYSTPGDIALDTLENILITGNFRGTTDFDPSVGVNNLTSAGGADIFISKIDSVGNFVWAINMGGASNDGGTGIILNSSGDICISGAFSGTADFDPTVGVYNLTCLYQDALVEKLGEIVVWPGDADHNNVANNFDLLPIGLFYGATGTPRATISNSWQAYTSTDWGITEPSGADIKHADCNGDGIINSSDTLAVNLNFSLTHAYAPIINDERMVAPDLHFVTSAGTYTSGSMVDVEVWAGTSTLPVSNLYGLAFTINYDASLVQPASESLTYPASWLGAPGTDAIKIGKIDALATKAYGAETRIDHANASGFGKIADFKFQLKSSIPSNTVMHFSTAGYSADNATGVSFLFNTPADSIIINPSSVGINEVNNGAQISVYPNPSNGSFNLFISSAIKNGSVEVYNSLGKLILNEKIVSQQNSIDLKDQKTGLYFVKVMSDGKIVGVEKVVKE